MIRPIRSILRRSGEWGIGLKYSSLFLLRQTEYLLIESIFHDIQKSSVVNTAALDVFAIKGISLLSCAASCIFRKLSKSLEKICPQNCPQLQSNNFAVYH